MLVYYPWLYKFNLLLLHSVYTILPTILLVAVKYGYPACARRDGVTSPWMNIMKVPHHSRLYNST